YRLRRTRCAPITARSGLPLPYGCLSSVRNSRRLEQCRVGH
ncbi:phosphoenolpyruvate carboxylase family protein, partial [Vibrio parahaemolyticus V-223/04]